MTDISDIDLSGWKVEDLDELERKIVEERKEAEKRRKKEAREALKGMAENFGMSIEELMQTAGVTPSKSGRRSSKPIKYRNPEKPSQTWTGQGRRPQWFIKAVEAGKKPEDFEV